MNDPIKYLITGAAIAIVCGAAGTMGGVWLMKETASSQRPEIRSQKSGGNVQTPTIGFQPSAGGGPSSVFNGQRMPQNQFTMPSRPPGSTNTRFAASAVPGAISHAAFQKAQELPEVKKAREEFMEAQRKYVGLMQTAMGQTGISNQFPVISHPKAK
ncbi:MAG: hypothetical protein NTY01_10280 [Verrucomicrobia bacterium]|nr:hypothetical protein [Verrucomicrobiota bacterium]